MTEALEAEISRRCDSKGWAWVVSEDWRPGPASPPIILAADGNVEKQVSTARWYSACAFALPGKEIVAVTDEVHGDVEARQAVLRQLLARVE